MKWIKIKNIDSTSVQVVTAALATAGCAVKLQKITQEKSEVLSITQSVLKYNLYIGVQDNQIKESIDEI